MLGFFVAIVVGIVCIILGVKNTRGDISSLHSYHRNRVSEEDILPFGRLVGIGTIVIGVAIIIMGVLSIISTVCNKETYATIGTVLLVVGIVVGCFISFYAIKKYNKGIF